MGRGRGERVITYGEPGPLSDDDRAMEHSWRMIPVPPTAGADWFVVDSSSDKNDLGALARCGGYSMSAARIAEVLAGREVKTSNGNFLVPCPAHEDSSPSLSLRDTDRGVQVHCFAGCRPGDVYAAIRRKDSKLLEGGQTAPEPVKGSSEYERRQHEKAAWLWSRRRPIAGSIAEKYLRHARGITCPLPPTLGFLAATKPEHHPAMIGAFPLPGEPEPGVVAAPHSVEAVHLTLLRTDGSAKADVPKPKLMVGSPGARPIVIAPPNDLLALAITEGIEDALTAHQATGLGAWAAGAAGRMSGPAGLIPSYIESVTIYAHAGDKAGRDGVQGLADALDRRNRDNRDPLNTEILIEGLP